MTVHITSDANAIKNLGSQTAKNAWVVVMRGITNSTNNSAKSNTAIARWFGTNATQASIKLGILQQFISSSATLSFHYKAQDNNMAYVYPDTSRKAPWSGSYIIYAGTEFSTPPGNTPAFANMSSHTLLGSQVITLAHELSHLILGTNTNALHKPEKYRDDALDAATNDPDFALNNAENYGFCIEECS